MDCIFVGFSWILQADVLCNGDQWNDLMVIAIVAVLIFCGGFFTLNIYISLAAPSRFQNEIFQRRWKFMFIKFRHKKGLRGGG